MTIDEFKKYAIDINHFSAADVDEFTLMRSDELDEYQTELERDTGNLSDWDHLRAFFTLKSKIMMYEDILVKHAISTNDGGE